MRKKRERKEANQESPKEATQERDEKRERSLWTPPSPYTTAHKKFKKEYLVSEFVEYGVPSICTDGELWVVEAIV